MKPLTIDEQIDRQIEKGCFSGKEGIKKFLKTTSYYTINYDYEKYLIHDGIIIKFKIQDYKWLEETNERISKEALSIILRSERVIRNRIADEYTFYCKNNSVNYFTTKSFNVGNNNFPNAKTSDDKNNIKGVFINSCWDLYKKKKNSLDNKYHFNKIQDVPPFVIAQHLTFGQIRTFFKLLNKDVQEKIVSSFHLKISEFNSIIEKLNYLRNACAHGEFILDFQTLKGKKISNPLYHKYIYNPNFILDKNKVCLLPVLAKCSYLLHDNIKFYVSTMRNILEIANYNHKGSINKLTLFGKMGLNTDSKTVQKYFTK